MSAKKNKLSGDLLLDARCEFHELIELLGGAAGQLREAYTDHEAGNTSGAVIVADDLLLTLAELETKVSEVGAMVARWRTWAEQSMEGGVQQ